MSRAMASEWEGSGREVYHELTHNRSTCHVHEITGSHGVLLGCYWLVLCRIDHLQRGTNREHVKVAEGRSVR